MENKKKYYTSNESKLRYNNKTYKNYSIRFRLVDDADLIELIEREKAKGLGNREAFRNLIKINDC